MFTDLRERFKYYFENTISSGPLGVIKWLAILSLIAILFLALIILIFGIKSDPGNEEGLNFIEGAWKSLMATLDPGTMGGDEGWPYRMIRFTATLVGIFLISILIGIISSGIDEKLEELKKGRSRVLETEHTLILGWSEKIYSIIQQIVEANTNQKRPSIVVLAERDKVEMEDDIRNKVPNLQNTKLIVRSGNPLIASEVQIVNPNKARSIIILSPEKENADTFVIKSVLSFTNGRDRKEEPYNIIAEIRDEGNLEAAEVAGNGEAVFVLTSGLISRITAQTCRQSGLSVIYSDLICFEGDEIYFSNEKSLVGKTYKEAILSYETSAVIGVFTKNEEVLINPPMDTLIESGDSVIAISEDDDTVVVNSNPKGNIKNHLFRKAELDVMTSEKTLILGWNQGAKTIVEELDEYVASGSELFILHNEDLDIAEIKSENQKILFMNGKITDKATLESVHPEEFNHIIVLSNFEMEIQDSDAQTLICLLHLRNIGKRFNRNFSIVSEMRDLRNREIGMVTRADDFIVGENIISLILSQLSENKELKKVFDILFESEGSEIYLKPIGRYVDIKEPMDFYTLIERAAELNETAIGYRKTNLKDDPELNYGIRVNPVKSEEITFDQDDYLIVLSEN